jgi:septal ring factor EnvC (AmiA/AmiB activator)
MPMKTHGIQGIRHLRKAGVVILILYSVTSISASGALENDSIKTRTRLDKLEQQLKEKQAGYKKITRQEKKLIKELKAIDKLLKKYQQQLQDQHKTLTKNTNELDAIQHNLGQLEESYQQKKGKLAQRLRAIYKMGNLGYLTPLLAMSSYDNMQQQLQYLRLISKSDLNLISDIEQDMQAILKQKEALDQRKEDIARSKREITEQRNKIMAQQEQKNQLLQSLQEDKRKLDVMIRHIISSSKELKGSLPDLEDQQHRELEQIARQQNTKAIRFPKDIEGVLKTYEKHFRGNKGRLLWPVRGKIITSYGNIKIPGTNTYTFYKGVDIQARNGTPFYAVFKGTVKYADWFEGHGNLIIVDHGGNYYTVYAHADAISVRTGDVIETYQMLGKVGDTDSMKGPHLYFEIRANGKPDDPQHWLAKVR